MNWDPIPPEDAHLCLPPSSTAHILVCDFPECSEPSTAKSKSDLARHRLKHLSAAQRARRSWRCPNPGCEHLALQRSNMETHIRTHTGETPYTCDPCNLNTSSPASLTRHLASKRHKKAMERQLARRPDSPHPCPPLNSMSPSQHRNNSSCPDSIARSSTLPPSTRLISAPPAYLPFPQPQGGAVRSQSSKSHRHAHEAYPRIHVFTSTSQASHKLPASHLSTVQSQATTTLAIHSSSSPMWEYSPGPILSLWPLPTTANSSPMSPLSELCLPPPLTNLPHGIDDHGGAQARPAQTLHHGGTMQHRSRDILTTTSSSLHHLYGQVHVPHYYPITSIPSSSTSGAQQPSSSGRVAMSLAEMLNPAENVASHYGKEQPMAPGSSAKDRSTAADEQSHSATDQGSSPRIEESYIRSGASGSKYCYTLTPVKSWN